MGLLRGQPAPEPCVLASRTLVGRSAACRLRLTGDAVSQVASQTLHNMAAVDRGMDIPVYRPLAGEDKEQILKVARQIGTYQISCEPFEDCCPRFMPRSPVCV